jgi:hypothetical protein
MLPCDNNIARQYRVSLLAIRKNRWVSKFRCDYSACKTCIYRQTVLPKAHFHDKAISNSQFMVVYALQQYDRATDVLVGDTHTSMYDSPYILYRDTWDLAKKMWTSCTEFVSRKYADDWDSFTRNRKETLIIFDLAERHMISATCGMMVSVFQLS